MKDKSSDRPIMRVPPSLRPARNIYLVGFMGSGKSLVGATLARMMRRPFVDMDTVLARVFGMPIAEVFRRFGEPAFRELEGEFLARLAQRPSGAVVATGGGAPVDPANFEAMRRSGMTVHLDVPLDILRARLGAAEIARRPLWADPRAVAKLYRERRSVYKLSDRTVDGSGKPESIARRILDAYAGPSPLRARHGNRICPVRPTYEAAEAVARYARGRRVVLLTDRTVAGLHLDRYLEALPGAHPIVVPSREKSKTLRGAERVYRELLEGRFGRDDLLVALGGGMVTDLGAFVASTFKRGMDFVLVSTSLLGCVDAAVGGKAAVNLGAAKNQVGLFTVPRASILDLYALGTLPLRQVNEGVIEAYKTGLIWDAGLALAIEANLEALRQRELLALGEVAARSAGAKAQVVSRDFREGGLRRILNYGHTYGHAVEGWHQYRVSHGQSVAAGMLVATEISRARGLIEADWAGRIAATVLALAPRRFSLPDAAAAWPFMANDKKNRGGKVLFVLLAGPTQHVCVEDVTPEELQQAITSVERLWHE